ncbi:MAG TPA: acetate/propionate family kinase [Candidatus Limnocylindria bacterium]|nr:acetate/propionate family kinase [Candidatus Limnocylindria bacterium]
MRILVANAGSSSLKLSLLDDRGLEPVADAELDLGADATRAGGFNGLEAALDRVQATSADAVGHRVVHGGPRTAPAMVDDALLTEIEALDDLAPLHNAVAAAAIRELRRRLPSVPQVACFDTTFHASLPAAASRYALPADWVERFGIRRYGFHGLSVAWSVKRVAALLDRPLGELGIVVAHLGSGASVTAVLGGRSVATSMGMTPLEGIVMGTRSGSVDPGILLHLLRHGVGLEELEEGVAHRGGLLALHGSGGMRALEANSAAGDTRAHEALDLFVTRAAEGIAAAATALRQLDALVFTGGIGENSATVRGRICERLAVLGIRPPESVEPGEDGVLVPGPPAVAVVRAREDVVIARQVRELVTNLPA